MIKSMTGFGKAKAVCGNVLLTVEIKSLNGKALDAALKLPSRFKEMELEVRNIFNEKIIRGKLDCFVMIEKTETSNGISIDQNAFVKIYNEIKSLADKVGADTTNLLTYVINQPEVRCTEVQDLSEEEKTSFLAIVHQAVEQLDSYRVCEGKILEQDFIKRISIIRELLSQVDNFEFDRTIRIKERIVSRLNEIVQANIDENRLEQEMIYYIEKLDITEEKVRLTQHLDYFLQCLDNEKEQGKKLGFIAQEMGREINTLGSKANDAEIQMLVVKMKDELEKIKEQVANIL
ncbi:MAG: YicC/YloC family endoribonuclease [Bacteroidales bacterium]|nr:YicC family protein [Bacteroidales bacterium]MEE1097083.1 YicC/YloC family endoribonuclease [Bacteroidales bacterium]